jgi:hypothetical protein
MLPLLSSRVPVLREAAAWAVGWLAQKKEARRKAVNALLPLFDDPDPLVRITVVEAVGRAGDAQDLAPLVRMRNGIPEKPGIRPGPIPDPSAETELRAAVEWAILAIQGRIAGKRAKGACGKCSTPGCTVDHG